MALTTKTKTIIGIAAMAVISTLLIMLVFKYAEAFSSFAVALILIDVAVIKLWLVDKFILYNFNTLDEIKNGNMAAGLALLAYAVVIAAAVVSAFVVWR